MHYIDYQLIYKITFTKEGISIQKYIIVIKNNQYLLIQKNNGNKKKISVTHLKKERKILEPFDYWEE